MEDKNKNPDYANFGGGIVQPPSIGDLSDPSALSLSDAPPALGQLPEQSTEARHAVPNILLRLVKRADIILATLLVLSMIGVFLATSTKDKRPTTSVNSGVSSQFKTQDIALDTFITDAKGVSFGASSVVINGPLSLNSGLVVTPSLQPSSPKAGQLYYDQGTNQLAYYNGTQFVPLTASPAQQAQGVQSIGGLTGQVGLAGGLAVVGNQLINAGVLSLGGQSGAIVLGNGLNMTGNTLQNSGILDVVGGSGIQVTSNGNGSVTVSNIGAGSGTVSSSGGTAGRIPLFTSVQNIEDSLLSQSGSVVTVNGDLSVTGSLNLSSPLTVANGGTGTNTLAANGVIVGNGAGALSSVTAGGAGLCLLSTAGAPNFAVCPSASGVTSLNGLSGGLTIANASGAGSTITINDATTAAKGIASFNSTNFSVAAGAVNTIQNINSGATPTFAGVNTNNITPSAALTVGVSGQTALLQGSTTTITSNGVGNDIILNSARNIELQDNTNVTGNLATSGDVAVNGGDITSSGALNITPTGTLTAGSATQTFTLQGNDTSTLKASNGANTTIVGFTSPTANTTLNFPALSAGTYTICTTSGNCAGAGVTLQAAYNNSSTPEIVLDATRGALTIRDTLAGLGANLLEVQNNTGATTYLAVTSSGIVVTGTATVSSNINSSGGALQTGGTTRVDNSGNLTNIGNLGLSGTISGGTSVTGSGNFNSTAGGIQTNSTTRIDNSGNLTNIGTLTLSGAISGGTSFTGSGNVNTTAGVIQTNSTTRIDNSGNLVNIASLTASGSGTLQGGSLTLGTTSQAGSLVINDGSSNTGTLQVAALGQNTVYTLPDPGAGTATICLTSGNCSGVGGGVTTAGGTTNTIPKFTASQTIGDSSITDNGTVVTIGSNTNLNGNLDVSGTLTSGTANAFQVDASGNVTGGTYNSNTFTSSNLQFGAAATATLQSASSQALTITANAASTWSTSSGTLTVQSASDLDLKAPSGNVVIGTSDTTGTLLVVDVKTGPGDPTGTDGAIYYNSNSNAFRCYQNGAWANCITASGGFVSLQNAYDNGNTISTDATGDIAFTLNNQNFTIATAAGATGSTTFSLTDGSNASAPSQLVLITNNDVNEAIANGLTISSAAGGITDGLDVSDSDIVNAINVGDNTILGTTAVIDFTNFDVASNGAITSANNATLQGGTLTLGTNTQAGSVILYDGSSNTGTVQTAALGQNTVYTLPDPGSGTANICLSTGNCAGAGGGVTGSGTNNRITKFTSTGSTVGDSTITDNGTTVTTSVNLVVQGGLATVGVANSQAGTLKLADGGSAFSGSIITTTLGADRTYTLPDATGTFCLSTGNCLGGSGGGANTALSNLSSVAINTSLLSGSSTIDLGSGANPFRDLYLGGATTNNFKVTGTASAARTVTLDDLSGHVALVQTAGSSSAQTGDINASGTLIAGTALQGTLFKSADGAGASSAVTFRSGNTTGGTGLSTGSVTIASGDGSGTNTSSGNVSIDSGAKTGTGTNGSITIGGTNASAVGIGHSGITTTNAGALTVSQQLTANGGVSVAANQNLTLQNGSGVLSQTYSSSSASSAFSQSVTNSNSGASPVAINAYDLSLVGTATSGGTNTNTALKFEDPTAQANNVFYGMNFVGTGYTDILRVNGTQIISGSGKLQNAGLDSTINYANLTKVNTLTALGGTLTVGTTSQQGSLVLHDGNGQTATISVGSALAADTAIAIPTGVGASDTVCLQTLANCLGGAGGGANVALSNLSSVAINTSLLPGNTSVDLGGGAKPFRDLYLGGTATNNFKFTGAATAARTYTLDDLSGSIALIQTAGSSVAQTGDLNVSGALIAGTNVQTPLVKTADGAGASSGITFRSGNTTGGSGLSTGTVTIQSGDGSGTNTSSGNVSIDTGAKTGTGTTGTIILGNANASALILGRSGLTTSNAGALTVAELLTASSGATFNKTLTANSGGTQNVATVNFTSPADSSGTNVSQGLNIATTIGNATAGTNTANIINLGAVTGDAQVTLNAINVGALTGTAAAETAINIGAGWDNVLSVGGTPIINGSGVVQSAGISGSYTGITGVGTLTAGALGSGFTIVNVAQGGTGAGTFTSNGVLYGNGTGAIQVTAAGTTGQCLVGNTGSAPSWTACSSGVTLQNAYNNTAGGTPEIVLDSTRGALTVRDNATPIGANLFEVQNNAGTTTYLGLTTSALTLAPTVNLQGVNGSGVDAAGSNLVIAGGQSTGSANGGNIGFSISQPGTSGSGLNSLTSVVAISGANGSVNFKNALNSTSAFNIQNNSNGNLFTVDTSNSQVGINLGGSNTPSLTQNGLEVHGAIRVSGTGAGGFDTYTTPTGAGVTARLSVVNDDPGASGQIIAAGISGPTATANARVLSLFDNRNAGHQQTLAVFSPDENGIVGFNWDGSNSAALVGTNNKTTGGNTNAVLLQSGNVSGGNGSSGDVYAITGSIAGGTGGSTGVLNLLTGNGTGTNSSSGNIILDTGSKTGSGTTGSITIGGTNTSSVGLGHSGITTTSNGAFSVAANQNLTLQNGSGVFSQTYSTGSAGSAQVLSATNTNAGASSVAVNGQDITLVGTATSGGINTNSAIKFENPSAAANNVFYGMNFAGTGYTDILRVNGTQIINGSGVIQSAGVSGSYTGITGVGTLTTGALGAGFTTVAVGQGGTGATTFTSNGVLYGNGTGAVQVTAAGTTGQCLVGNTGAAPSWTTCTGLVTLQNAYNNGNTISTSSNDIGFTLNGSDKFTVATAAANTAGGVVFTSGNTSGTQTDGLLYNRNGAGGTTTNGIDITNTAGTLTNGLAFTGTIGTDINRASGTLTLQGGGGVSIKTANSASTTGSITIKSGDSSGASAGTILIDSGTWSGASLGWVAIGATNANLINLGNATAGTVLSIEAGTAASALQIGNGNTAHGIQIGTGAAAQTVVLGSMDSTSSTTVQGGSNNITLQTNGASTIVKSNTTNSTSAFLVQNAIGSNAIAVDTTPLNALVANGSLEGSSNSGWALKGTSTGTVARDGTQAYSGSFSEKVALTSTGNADGVQYTPTSFSANTTYMLSFDIKQTAGTDFTSNFAIGYNNGSDHTCTVNPSLSQQSITASMTGWFRFYCTFTTAASPAPSFIFWKETDTPASARTFFLDAVQLEQTSNTTPQSFTESKLQLNGVVNSPVSFQNLVDSTTSFQIQSASGANNIFTADTLNGRALFGNIVTSNTTSNATQVLIQANTGNRALSVQANGTQDALDIYNSTGTNVAGFDKNGALTVSGASGSTINIGNTTTNTAGTLNLADANNHQLSIQAAANIANSHAIQLDTSLLTATRAYTFSDASGTICLNTGNCSGANGYIVNGTTQQTANFNILGNSTTSATAQIQGINSGTKPVLNIRNSATPSATQDLLSLQDSAGSTTYMKVDYQGKTTHNASVAINDPGDATAFTIQGSSATNFLTVDSAANKFYIGNVANCSGRFCVENTVSNPTGSTFTNSYNSSTFTGTSTAGNNNFMISQDIVLTDTSTTSGGGVNTLRGIRIDMSGTTNTGDTLNGILLKIPSTTSNGNYSGNTLQVQNGAVNILKQTNIGAFQLQTTTGSATAFQVLDSSSTGLLTVDTTARSASGGNLVKIGDSTGTDGATTILQLDSASADPTSNLAALNGGLFYNSTTNKVSLIENGTVKIICNTTDLGCGTGTVTLQNAYHNSTGGTTSEIIAESTQGALDIQDRSTSNGGTLGGNLLNVRATAANDSTAGALMFSIGNTGAVKLQNSADSTSAFQIQNAAGANQINVNTLTTGNNLWPNPSFEQSISGVASHNTSTLTYGNGAPTPIAGLFGLNDLSVQMPGTANNGVEFRYQFKPSTTYALSMWVRADSGSTTTYNIGENENGGADSNCTTTPSTITVDTTWRQYTCSFTTGTTIGVAGNSYFYFKINTAAAKNVYIDGVTLVTGSTPLNYANPGSALQVEPYSNNIAINALNNGEVEPWRTNAIPLNAAKSRPGVTTANGYIYVLGGGNGVDGGASPTNSVLYAKVNADGSLGNGTTWSTASNLNTAMNGGGAVVVNGYIYLVGGSTGAVGNSDSAVVQYAKLNPDGTTGTWNTTTALPAARDSAGVVAYNGYIYVLGGSTGNSGGSTLATTVYGKVNTDGTISSWTAGTTMGFAREVFQPVVANGYIFAMGGTNSNGSGTANQTESVKLNADGTMAGAWVTGTNLPAPVGDVASTTVNGVLYVISGWTTGGSATKDIFYGTIPTDNVPDVAWSTSANQLPISNATAARAGREGAKAVAVNGYIYLIGGDDTNAAFATVFYTSTPRLKVAGTLDLVGLSGQNLADGLGSGGSLTAGNTTIVGTFQVQDAANFARNLNISGNLTTSGAVAFANTTNSTNAFQVQNAAGANVISVDTSGSNLVLGQSSTLTGNLVFANASTANKITITSGATAGSGYTLTLPVNAPSTSQCLQTDVATASQLVFGSCSGQTIVTISRASGFPVDNQTNGNNTVSVTPAHAGDLVLINVIVNDKTKTVSSIASTNTTGWHFVNGVTDNTNNWREEVWAGTATSTSAATVTVTYNASLGGATAVQTLADSFTAGLGTNGTWSTSPSGATVNSSSSTNMPMPSLLATGTGQAYWGFAAGQNTGTGGTGSGFSFTVRSAPFTTVIGLNTSLSAGTTYSPVGTQNTAGFSEVAGVIIGASANAASSINNNTVTQLANFNVQAATSGSVAGVLEANASGSGDILDLLNGSGVTVGSFGSTGAVTLQNSTNSTTAFQIQNAGGAQLINVDTTNTITDITNNAANNLISNGSMELNATGWAVLGSASSVARDTSQQYIGNAALKVVTTASATDGAKFALTTSTLVSNTKYTFTVHARATAGTTFSTFEMGRADNGSTNTSCLTAQTISNSGWTTLTCTFTTGTTSGTPYIYVKQTDATARSFWIDGIQLTRYSLVANASVEQALTASDWVKKGNASDAVSRDTTFYSDGASSLKIVTTANANDGTKNNITLNDSTVYTLSFQAQLGPSSAAFATMEAGYSSDGSTDNTVCTTAQTVVTVTWTTYTCTFVTPSSHSGTPYFYIKQTNAAIHTFYIDAVQLTIGNPLGAYQEGKIALNGVINSPVALQNQSNSTEAFQVRNAAGAALFKVDTVNNNVSVNTGSSSTTSPAFSLLQSDGGDATMLYGNPANSFFVGVDTSDNSQFKISSANSNGATAKFGYYTANVLNANGYDSGNSNMISATKVTSGGSAGTLNSISVYVGALGGAGQMQVAIYSFKANGVSGCTFASGCPDTKLGSSSTYNLTANSWNTIPVTASIAASTTYWLAFNVDDGGTKYGLDPGTGSDVVSYYQNNPAGGGTTTFGNWPTTITTPASSGAGNPYRIYATYTTSSSTDSFAGGSLFSVNADGAATFKTSTNSNQGLRVQNSLGNSVLTVDTYNNDSSANLIPDGSFEKGTTGWGVKGTLTTGPEQRPNQHHSGRASMYAEGQNGFAGGPEYDITLTDNTQYQASFYIKNSTTDKPATGVVQAGYNNGTSDTACSQNTANINSTGWTRIECSFTTPGTHSGTPYFFIQRTDTGQTDDMWIDDVFLAYDYNGNFEINSMRNGSIDLQGPISSDLRVQQSTNSSTAFTVQNQYANSILTVDTTDTGNLILNGSFEKDITNGLSVFSTWGPTAAGNSVSRDLTQAAVGNASLQIVATGTALSGATLTTGNTYPTKVEPSATYSMSWYAKLSSGTFTDIKAGYAPDGSTWVDCIPSSQTVVTGGWTRFSCSFATTSSAPNGSAAIRIVGTAGATRTFWIDGVRLEAGGTANQYANGSLKLDAAVASPLLVHTGSDSTNVFTVQNAAGSNLFSIDSVNSQITIGTVDTTATLLVLDTKTNSGDPTGVAGAMYYNSNSGTFRCFEIDGTPAGYWRDCMQSARTSFYYMNDLTGTAADNETQISGTGAGAGGTSTAGSTGHPGTVTMSTGTTGTGVGLIGDNDNGTPFLLGNGDYWRWETDLQIPTLSVNGTQQYVIKAGLTDAGSGAPTDGCWLSYSSTQTFNNHWQGNCANNTTTSTCDTGITVAINTWYRLAVVVNSAGTSTDFQVNGVSKCQVTTNIPTTTGRETSWNMSIVKSVGTTASTMLVDYIEIRGQFGTGR